MKKNWILTWVFLGAVAGIMGFVLAVYVIFTVIDNVKESYAEPDTTIVIHNGVPDTIITIKQPPAWIK